MIKITNQNNIIITYPSVQRNCTVLRCYVLWMSKEKSQATFYKDPEMSLYLNVLLQHLGQQLDLEGGLTG